MPGIPAEIRLDFNCVDNVIMFLAIAQFDVPWFGPISCSDNKIEDDGILPHNSECSDSDFKCCGNFCENFREVFKPIHDDFNEFQANPGEGSNPIGQFIEASPRLNFHLWYEPEMINCSNQLEPSIFSCLEGCVRKEEPLDLPEFPGFEASPLAYSPFGSLDADDMDLLARVLGHRRIPISEQLRRWATVKISATRLRRS